MPEIYGDIRLVYSPYANRAYCLNFNTADSGDFDPVFSVEQTIEQGKFIQDGDVLNLPLNYDEAINYNYIIAHIKSRSGYWQKAYFFITAYEYRNAEVCAVKIELDSVQTFFNFIDRCEGKLKRAHAPQLLADNFINPDLYFQEDEPIDRYTTEYVSVGYSVDISKPSTPGLCLVLNVSEDTIEQPVDASTTTTSWPTTARIRCNPKNNQIRDYPSSELPSDWDNEAWFNSSFHQAFRWQYINGTTEEKASYTMAYRSFLNLVFDYTAQYGGNRGVNHTNPTITATNGTQLIVLCLYFNNSVQTDFSMNVNSTTSHSGGNTEHCIIRSGLDGLLWLGPLLADKIVAAFPIPRLFNSDYEPGENTAIPARAEAGVMCVNCNGETGNESEVGEELIYNRPAYNTIATGWIITDLKALASVCLSAGDAVYNDIVGAIEGTGTESPLHLQNEYKLLLYPYRWWAIDTWGLEIPYKLQDLSYMFVLGEREERWETGGLLAPYVLIDPLASSPTIYGDYLGSFTNLFGWNYNSIVNSYATIYSSIVQPIENSGMSNFGLFTGGIGSYLKERFLYRIPENQAHLPTLAVYQDSYQEYQNYSKALAIVNNEYAYNQADIARTQSLISGTLGVLGGAASVGLGSATGGIMGGSTIAGGLSSMASSVGSLITSGQTYNNQVENIYNSQQAKETASASKPPSQTGGNSSGNTLSYSIWGAYNSSFNATYAMIRYSYPPRMLTLAYQKFKRWGYSIPLDVILDGDNRINAIPGWKQNFCYIQFDSVSSLTFADPDDSGRLLIPRIYQQDIEQRLCSGITFINIRDASTDISSYEVNYSEDNPDEGKPTNPLFNTDWINAVQ